MVAKKVAGVAGAAAGGFLNNPGAIAAVLGITGIIAGLVIFRKDISNFFGRSFGEAAVEGAGAAISSGLSSAGENITNFFTNLELPTFELPTFEFPMFPSFTDIFGEPGEPGESTDFTDVGMAAARARQDGAGVDPQVLEEDFPSEFSIVADRGEPFDIIEETQAEFQERAAAFVEVLPEVTAFTSLPGSVTDFVRRQLSRESEDFEDVLAAEARRSETIFAGLFGNVQNPEFGA